MGVYEAVARKLEGANFLRAPTLGVLEIGSNTDQGPPSRTPTVYRKPV